MHGSPTLNHSSTIRSDWEPVRGSGRWARFWYVMLENRVDSGMAMPSQMPRQPYQGLVMLVNEKTCGDHVHYQSAGDVKLGMLVNRTNS